MGNFKEQLNEKYKTIVQDFYKVMAKTTEDKLRNILNASGFLFQLCIENEITKTAKNHKWNVVSREHPWSDQAIGNEGFIDLVLRSGIVQMVVECKRPRDGSWIFIVPEEKRQLEYRLKCLWTDFIPPNKILSGWDEFSIAPPTLQSEFCIIRGQGEEGKTLLERISGQLLISLDCLAKEELEINQGISFKQTRIYIPVIITSAELIACHLNLEEISLSEGTIEKGIFQPVPFIRFRKSLTTKLTSQFQPKNVKEANENKERSILVINSNHLADILQGWKIERMDEWEPYPWELARQNEGIEQ